MSALKKSALIEAHKRAGARLVDFSGWEMPLHYGSQIEEHHQIRREAGMFDVSHMVVSTLSGVGAKAYLQHLLANDVGRLIEPGKALYSCMLNPQGGVIDDLIVYWMGEDHYRIITNAATREDDIRWMQQQLEGFEATLMEQPQLAMVAVQGPKARSAILEWLSDDSAREVATLGRFFATEVDEGFIARTGYTGEDGFEVVLAAESAEPFWQAMVDAGIPPCGLGARDTLRLEAGMMLYGADMDTTTTPLESALGWSVALEPAERKFMGRSRLEQQKAEGVSRKLVGLL
ncbi:MAG: glycine cleavage system aminomethyltransferase GcvT, partial [Gammaproteobacteria bacterium]|nr:glycine cleavage system aminomethyltransferase GcvT [Gammaproteobacteria bacterium]